MKPSSTWLGSHVTAVLRSSRRNICLLTLTAVLLWTPARGMSDEPDTNSNPVKRQTENVLLVTIDGLRWQEVFGGADESYMDKEFGGVKDIDALKQRFLRDTQHRRCNALMPFFWSTIAKQGRVYGNPEHDSIARVENPHMFSYPGYNEILTGIADPSIDSNDKNPNPHVTVLEWLHQLPGFNNRIRAFCSWDVFPYIINSERSGIPVNAGWQPLAYDGGPTVLKALDHTADQLPHYWENVRYDYFTFRGALACIEYEKPRVLYVAFGETDDWAHAGRYDLYLDAARRTDQYIARLWKTMQKMPEYAGKTSLVLTTDHGRGDTREDWKSHSDEIPGSQAIWIAVMGPETPPGHSESETVTQSQIAASIASLLGHDYHAAVPRSGPPLPQLIRHDR